MERSLAVGGEHDDSHTEWVAGDTVYTGGRVTNLPRPAGMMVAQAEALADELGLRIIHEADHDHVQPKDWVPPKHRV